MRINMLAVRKRHKKTQVEAAELIGCSRMVYHEVENGMRQGKEEFWTAFQRVFSVPDADMWRVMQDE